MNHKTIAAPGVWLGLLILGFSDTAVAQPNTITTTPQQLMFTVVSGGVSPAQPVHVDSTFPTTVVIQVDSNSSWLHVGPGAVVNTPADLSVTVNAQGITPGSYMGTFTVTMSGQSSGLTVQVGLTVTGSTVLSVNPASMSFVAQFGATQGSPQGCPAQITSTTCQLAISSSGPVLNYTVFRSTNDAHPWLLIDRDNGTTGGTPLNVGVNPAAVPAAGTYTGTITVQSTTTIDAVAISVTLTVGSIATLSVAPTGPIQFLYQTGTAAPAPQQLTVSSNGGFVPFQVSVAQNQLSWLTVTPQSGSAGSGSPAILTLIVTPAGLLPGNYPALVTITPAGGISLPPVQVNLLVSNNPFLTAPTALLNFSAQFGGLAPPAQQITVGSTGGALNFTASASSTPPGWLSVSPGSGTTGTPSGTLSVSASPSGLVIGTYNGMITLAPTNGDQYTVQIPVTLTVGASSQVNAAPSALVFSFQTSQVQPAAQVVQLSTTGPPVSFTVATSVNAGPSCGTANWISAVAQGPVTPTTLTVSVNTSGMTSGSCTGKVTVTYTSGSANVNLDIPVTLFVSNSPLLNISLPQGFGLETATQGGSVITRRISLTSTDTVTSIPFSLTFQSSPCAWLIAASATGGTSGTTPGSIILSILPGCLTPGSYQGSITISSTNLPIPVTLNITLLINANVTLTVTPQSLTFTQFQGSTNQMSQTLSFHSSGGDANFIATAATDFGGTWLSVNPTSGNTSIGTLTVSAGSTVLPSNSYTGHITITFQGAITSSITIPVTLTISSPQTVSITPNQPLSFTFQIGGTAPASQKITITSTGGAVQFSVGTTSSGWLSVDASSGSTSKDINVSVNPLGLLAGVYIGSISISAPGVLLSPIVINVTLTVLALPPPQPFTITSTASNLAGLIAPGEEITIKGSNLGPASPALGVLFTLNPQGFVDPSLAGVRVLFDGNPGTPVFVSATQINVVVPFEIAGTVTTNIVVEYQGVQSAPRQQLVSSAAPGIYTLNFTGQGQAAVINQDGTINGPPGGVSTPGGVIATKPALPNTAISVYMTGGGQTNPPSITGSVNSLAFFMPLVNWTPTSGTVTATIGGVPAKVEFAGAAPGLLAGIVQVNLRVPNVTGNALAIVITINGVSTSLSPLAPTVAVQ